MHILCFFTVHPMRVGALFYEWHKCPCLVFILYGDTNWHTVNNNFRVRFLVSSSAGASGNVFPWYFSSVQNNMLKLSDSYCKTLKQQFLYIIVIVTNSVKYWFTLVYTHNEYNLYLLIFLNHIMHIIIDQGGLTAIF